MFILSPSASLEAATAAASDVTTTILAQRIELDNKNKTIEMMQKSLAQQRELTLYHAKEMEKDSQKKLDLLKTEYESRIQRHQSFIDQVIVCICVYIDSTNIHSNNTWFMYIIMYTYNLLCIQVHVRIHIKLE